MRDLQKDLDWALKAKEFPVVLVSALERAIKAEALNRELIEALDFLLHRKYTGDTEERILGAARLLAKAKREAE